MKQSFLSVLGVFCIALIARAQLGGFQAPSVDLHRIETDTVRVIFSDGHEEVAGRVAGIFHRMAREYPVYGNDKLRKISVILQDKTDVPNGYVGLAPWRSEFFLSPPQNNFQLGSLPWADLLAVHEFRHVQQRSAGKRGLSKIAYYLMGEQAYAAFLNVSWPNWYTEGDAVIAETALTPQGRGRLPAFMNAYRTKVLSGEQWNYEKARNGSFREFVPDHYELGFLLMQYGRELYDQHFWDSVALHSAAYKGVIYPFSRAVEKESGLSTREMYFDMLEFYRRKWSVDKDNHRVRHITVPSKRFIDRSYPVYDEAGNLYYVEEGFDRIATIRRRSVDGRDKKITALGYEIEPAISYGGGKLCWSERRLHPRWTRQDYSVIMVCDAESGRKRQITRASSYFTPGLTPDGQMLAAVFDNDNQQFAIHILDADNGDVLNVLPNPRNYYFSFPTWSADTKSIIVAMRDNKTGKMSIGRYALETGQLDVLIPWADVPVGRPLLHEGWVYFASTQGMTDQVFRLSLESGNIEQVTDHWQSLYTPVIDPVSEGLVTSEYSLSGSQLIEIPADDLASIPVQQRKLPDFDTEPREASLLDSINTSGFVPRRYGHLSNPINIHSWNPYVLDPEIGIEVLSENVLSNLFLRFGYEYNTNNSDHGPFADLTFSAWYPELLLGYNTNFRSRTNSEGEEFNFAQHSVNTGFRLPFRSFIGPYRQFAFLTSRIHFDKVSGDLERNLRFLSHRLEFTNERKQARQHALPRVAQAIDAQLNYSIDAFTARQFHVETDFTFPSPHRNHVFWLQGDYLVENDEGMFYYSDPFNYARGYGAYRAGEIYRIGLNYHMPLVYPDAGAFGVIYLYRIRLNLFADYSRAFEDEAVREFRSVGGEFLFDVNLLNIQPFSFGLRYAALLDPEVGNSGSGVGHRIELFLPVIRF